MTRILAGRGKGRRLLTPAGDATRPSPARVRQTLFDILAPRMPGCRFLDACAGSGGIGFEALSRGATRVVFVETSAAALAALRENARGLRQAAGGEVELLRQDARIAMAALAASGRRFDVIYLDPPYASDLYEPLIEAAERGSLLAEGGVLVAEHFKKRALPETIGRLARTRSVRVGDHVLSFYAWAEPLAGGSLSSRPQGVAVFPGSFDPITNGHLDIIGRGLKVFERVIVAILVNADKRPLFTTEERVSLIQRTFRGNRRVRVDTFSGLLVDYAVAARANVIVRGLRALSDFEYEFQMALMNRRLNPNIETVFMMPAEHYSYLSSRLVKEVFQLGGDVRGLVPPVVERLLSEKYEAVPPPAPRPRQRSRVR